MYIDIGGNLSVRSGCIVGVFDLDNTSWSKWTRQFLQQAQRDGLVVEATDSLPKSFVITWEYGQQRVYLTQYNSAILTKRLQQGLAENMAERAAAKGRRMGVFPCLNHGQQIKE